MKNIGEVLGIIGAVLFLLSLGSCLSGHLDAGVGFLGGGIVVMGIGALISNRKDKREKEERERKRKKAIYELDEEDRLEMLAKYGNITTEIRISNHQMSVARNEIIVFEQSSTLLIQNVPYKFDDILDVEIYNNSKSIYSGTVSADLGGALIGGALFGGAGAVVGGMSSQQQEGETITVHNYDVVLTLNSLSTPMLKINFADNQHGVQEFASTLSVIFRQRKNQNS